MLFSVPIARKSLDHTCRPWVTTLGGLEPQILDQISKKNYTYIWPSEL